MSKKQTERKHTPLPKVYSMRHLVIHTDSASVMVECNSSDTANKVVRIWNSHDKLVDGCELLIAWGEEVRRQYRDIPWVKCGIEDIRAALADIGK